MAAWDTALALEQEITLDFGPKKFRVSVTWWCVKAQGEASWVCGLPVWADFPFVFSVWCDIKGKLVVFGGESSGLWGFPCGCQNQRGTAWVDVWLNFGCFVCAESTPSPGEVELQVLEGGWALGAQTGNCSSSPWSSCWQILACLYCHPCPSVDSFSPSYSADVNYERLSLLKLDLPALSLLRCFECCNTA